MEITSSLLNDKYFTDIKNSLIAVSEKDNKADFRVHLIEYINDTADNNDGNDLQIGEISKWAKGQFGCDFFVNINK